MNKVWLIQAGDADKQKYIPVTLVQLGSSAVPGVFVTICVPNDFSGAQVVKDVGFLRTMGCIDPPENYVRGLAQGLQEYLKYTYLPSIPELSGPIMRPPSKILDSATDRGTESLVYKLRKT